ncbi:helix-turn-helix transcriptional regulator [Nocardioidaceae bacterium SCSIO 66511]|nr:helix-turn-helix transcriptional regulator [Nocardioidaceae bacterium SCSIO 66511]
MSQDLSTTSYALLGLLAFDARTSEHGLTGYELKQRADFTLRFYWTSPAMSQIYSELSRLARSGLVEAMSARQGRRTTRRYRITDAGTEALTGWLATSEPEFPVLKHPVALRLLMGQLMGRDALVRMLDAYEKALADRQAELEAVRRMLADRDDVRYPALVADWGLAHYESEREITERTRRAIADE